MNEEKSINHPAAATEAQYVAPQIEIIEVETAQNILGGSPGATVNDMQPEEWQ